MAKNNKPHVIDIEDLIRIVREKTCLWDQKNDANYFKRDYQRVAWMEVADDMKAPVSELKKRWRGLRDTFGRELRKIEQGTPPAPAPADLTSASNWRPFPRLLFLRDVIEACRTRKPTKRKKNIKEEFDDDALDNGDDTNVSISERSSSVESEHEDPLTSSILSVKMEVPAAMVGEENTPPPPKRCLETSERFQETLHQFQETPAPQRTQETDADAQFLLSLLPFLREVPMRRKLLVRASLAQVLIDEQHAGAGGWQY